jgi:hypothetical protein
MEKRGRLESKIMHRKTPLKTLKIYRCSRRYMTLIESIISMFLLSMLLVVIFGFFRELSHLNDHSKKTIREGFQKRYVESRLAYVFANVVNENDTKRRFYFYTVNDEVSHFPGLIFTFYNEITLDPEISGDVLARLFVDAKNRLCLVILPLLRSKSQTEADLVSHQRVEYLMKDVQNFSFKFFSAPNPDPSLLQNKEGPPQGEWVSEWDKTYKQVPAIVQIEVQQGDRFNKPLSRVFSFVLPTPNHPVTFVQP